VAKESNYERELWDKIAHSDGQERVEAYIQLSYSAFHEENVREALALLEAAKSYSEQNNLYGNSELNGHLEFGIGYSLKRLKNFVQAAEAFQRSKEIYLSILSDESIQSGNEEGLAWFSARKYERSLDAYASAIGNSIPVDNEADIAENYVGAGYALSKLKRWEEALDYFDRAKKIYKDLKDPERVANVDEEISLCYFWMGDPINAEAYAQKALDFANASDSRIHLMWANARLALAKKLSGNYNDALELFELAKKLMTSSCTPPWKSIVKLESQVAEIHENLGNLDLARDIRRRALVIQETVFDPEDELPIKD
jgi:tetratricopeptide (TPR) repeat protein